MQQRKGLWRAVGAFDQRSSNWLYWQGTRVPRPAWKLLEISGDGLVWLSVAIVALVYKGISIATRRLWANLLLGLIVDLLEVGTIKALTRRARPVHNCLTNDMVVVVAVDHFSFPSGHAARASFLAIYAALVVGASAPWLTAAAAAWAVTLGVSRCAMGRHYVSDVVAGLLLGLVTVAVVTHGQFSEAALLLDEQDTKTFMRIMRTLVPALR